MQMWHMFMHQFSKCLSLLMIKMLKAFDLVLKCMTINIKILNYAQTRFVQIYSATYDDCIYAKMLINGFVTYVAQIRANKLKCTHIYKHCKYVIHNNDYYNTLLLL